MTFNPPVKAVQYLLRHAIDLEGVLTRYPGDDISDELVSDVLSGAASFASDILAPLNWAGDQNPATIEGDNVIASPGFDGAYKAWVEGGWQSLPVSPEIGGMGLPQVVSAAAAEMFYAANMAFGLCPMLTASAIKAIDAHGSDELKATYLEKMVTGEWSGAMNLTEPQAGSDLSVLRAKASPNPDGSYAISGQKIYITWGDHDCAENIIHLVLARLPDAPAGSKGISLFLCPKYFVNSDGSLGERNSFMPISLEHKLGIHGSPTCVMEFENATGWLVGQENRGLACMFTMMNEARLFVGVQGVGIGERAFQGALTFANERVQGRVLDNDAGAPIVGHPDVRRMLIDMKARLMGARAICLATASASDMAVTATDPDERAAYHAREALLTPLAKSYGSDTGVAVTSTAIQVFGGMGFVEETGAAQHYRDSRIAPIYEGTNGIQAIDLVGRKLRRDGGEAMSSLMADLNAIATMCAAADGMDACHTALSRGLEALKSATDHMLKTSEKDALSAATPYQTLCASVVSGALLIKAVCKGLVANDADAPHMRELARYHAQTVMSEGVAQMDMIVSGAEIIFDLPEDRLADL